MNEKAARFDALLAEKKINWFGKQERDDEFKSVVYRGNLDINGKQLPIFIVLDATVFTVIRVFISTKKVAKRNRARVDNYFNELNGRFKIFKYYVSDEDDAVYLDVSVPSQGPFFDGELLLYLIGQIVLPHLEEYLPKIEEHLAGKNN